MKIDGTPYRTIWLADNGWQVIILDQTKFPHAFETATLATLEDAAHAIQAMLVRGAPLIGATAAYGMALAMWRDASDQHLGAAYETLLATRPTAINLKWALDRMHAHLAGFATGERTAAAYKLAGEIADEDVAINAAIGRAALPLIKAVAATKNGAPVNILTHCNAGWLATVDWGTATAPIYMAHDAGIAVHVWVDETRPRNQGASLTAWELGRHGVPHTLIVDNAGGHYMQQGQVDMVIVGTDRTTASGDVCNKIGTYLKALAAHDNNIPFYVTLPSPTIDFTLDDGMSIPIEERNSQEVTHLPGLNSAGMADIIAIAPVDCPAANPAFDVTPARLVTKLVTERGLISPNKAAIAAAFPERVVA